MSKAKRKIGFYSIKFKENPTNKEDTALFDKTLFCDFIDFINTEITDVDKLIKNTDTNKATMLETCEIYIKENLEFVKMIFKTCKYNHSPDYMSSDDGSERESPKDLKEGEKEITHLLGKFNDDEIEIILEERRSGISISGIIKYLNNFIAKYCKEKNIEKKFKFEHGIIPMDNFEDSLNNLSRVCEADIFVHKKLLGAEGLKIMNRTDICMKDAIKVSCTVKRGESLKKRTIKNLYNSMLSEGSEISRVRIYGKDENNINILLDSDVIKKVEHIDTVLNEHKGIVDSYSFFSKVEEIFGVSE